MALRRRVWAPSRVASDAGTNPRRKKTNKKRLEEAQERVGSIMSMRVMLLEINGAGGQVEFVVFCKVPD